MPTATSSSSGRDSLLRSGTRLVLLALSGPLAFVAWALGTLVVLPFPRRRRAVQAAVQHYWARGVGSILGLRVRVEGTPPPAPYLLVSNHLGYLDIVAYGTVVRGRFVAKREVRGWPLIGPLAAMVGTIFIDRTLKRDAVRALDVVQEAVADGDGVIVFAEATSTAGQTVLPFRPALLDWAARSGHPVHYASVEYRTPPGGPPAHLAVCWWGEMTFGGHVAELARLPWIEATVRFGAAPIAEPDRKRLAGRLHQAVAAQFIPVVTE
ncbi:MAG: 1-acyl-sn-glycerol-3-phosphate acyltransferase [Gemmatimonadetes bacterium]|nr:1-acyl-sn-glycerol-3-phosphate acyltransferase [Gemmatimonadota bacterium]